MNELVEFLTARLDEDELVAQAAARLQDDPENGWGVARSDSYAESEKRRWIAPHIGMLYEAESAAHVARHDPARVLREIEAKRQIIADHERIPGDGINYTFAEQNRAEDLLKALALPYADRPGWKEEWRA